MTNIMSSTYDVTYPEGVYLEEGADGTFRIYYPTVCWCGSHHAREFDVSRNGPTHVSHNRISLTIRPGWAEKYAKKARAR